MLIGWTEFRSGDRTSCCQYFSKNGAALTSPIQLGVEPGLEPTTVLETRPLTLPDGRAIVFFTVERTGAPAGQGSQLYAQRMAADFTKLGNPVRINGNPTIASTLFVFATLLTDGNIGVVWQRQRNGPTIDFVDTYVRIVDKNCAPQGPEQRATRQVAGSQRPTSIAPLANGRSVFTYAHRDLSNNFRVFAQVLGPTGVRVGNPILLKSTTDDRPFGTASVATRFPTGPRALPGNQFHALIYREVAGGKVGLFSRLYRQNGSQVRPETRCGTVDFNQFSQAAPLQIIDTANFVCTGICPNEGAARKEIEFRGGDAAATGPISAPTTIRWGPSASILIPEDAYFYVQEQSCFFTWSEGAGAFLMDVEITY